MPYSYQTTIASSSTTGPFYFTNIDGYLSISHLSVYVNNAVVSSALYTINTVAKSITFSSPVGAGSVVKIQRTTPKTVAGRVVDFNDASVLTAANLDDSALQNLYISQEAEDTGSNALPPNQDGSAWDASSKRILNVATPLSATDAVNRSYVDTAILGGQGPWTSPQAWTFTSDGTSTYSWTANGQQAPNSQDVNTFLVEVGGVIQHPVTNYTVNANSIVFATNIAVTNPPTLIRVRNFGVAAALPTWSQTTAFQEDVNFAKDITVTGDAIIDGIKINNGNSNDPTSLFVGSGGTTMSGTSRWNTVVGQTSMDNITTGANNTVVGNGSSQGMTTGYENTAVGSLSLRSGAFLAAHAQNVTIGYKSGYSTQSPVLSGGIYIGCEAAPSGAAGITQNEIVIGTGITGDGSNTTKIGTSSTTQTKLSGNLITTGAGTSQIGGALEVNGNITLKAGGTGTIASALLPPGSIRQFLSFATVAGTGVAVATVHPTYTDVSLSGTITPTSTSSKIFVIVSSPINARKLTANTTSILLNLKLVRGVSTDVALWPSVIAHADGLSWGSSGAVRGNQVTVFHLDSPATTSATTYKVQGALGAAVNGGAMDFPGNTIGQGAVMYLIEIA